MACTWSWNHRYYTLEQLLPLAKKLAAILYKHKHVTGIALTGSVARMEDHVHDVDLVLLHDGGINDAMTEYPPVELGEYSYRLETLHAILPWKLHQRVVKAASDVHLNLISVHEKILTDCSYLREVGKTARDVDFFNRVFCDIPLRLLLPGSSSGLVAKLSRDHTASWWKRLCGYENRVAYKDLRHQCTDTRCLPSKTWAVRSQELKLVRETNSYFSTSGY